MPSSTQSPSIRIPHNGTSDSHNQGPARREVSSSFSMSTSPTDYFHPRKQSFGVSDGHSTSPMLRRTITGPQPKQLKPFREEDIKILLLENVNQTGQDILRGQGYQVEALKSSLPEDQLIEKIKYVLQIPRVAVLKMKYSGFKYHRPVRNAQKRHVEVLRCLPSDPTTRSFFSPSTHLIRSSH
jgi:hypothetical protein